MHERKLARRQILKTTLLGVAGIAALRANTSHADGLAKLSRNDATATGLDYHADAKLVDSKDYPEYEASQSCATCIQLLASGDQHGCKLMPGKEVNLNGWCKVWAAKS
jgi:hypothetical protein